MSATAATTGGARDAIVVEHLRVVRGDAEVLPDLSLRVPAGSVTGLLGPSGSGKSTLLRSIMGVQRTAGGTVTILGAPAGEPALRRRVGYVTQAPSVYVDLSVAENLRYFARLLQAPTDDVERVIAAVGLGGLEGRVVARLSGGQTARVSLAAALLGAPELLVLDEPTVGLDPALRRDLWALFTALAAGGTTILISSHVMDEAEHCETLVLLREGRVIATGSPGELRARTGVQRLDEVFLHLIDGTGTPAPTGTEEAR